jgi:outer membrane lipoprotein-sorting protein
MPSAAGRCQRAIKRRNRLADLAPAALCAATAAMLVIGGCAAVTPPPAPGAPAHLNGQVAQLTSAMAERDRALQAMQTSAVMEYSNGDQHVKAREDLVVRRPASLRVEAMSPFGVALIVAAQDSRLQIFEPSRNTLMHGTASAATLARFARIPMAPRDAVGLLMGIVPEAQNSATPDSVANDGGVTVLTYSAAGGKSRELGFENNQLVMVREREAGGAVNYEIRYADYHDIGGVMFPYQVDAEFPAVETHVSFRYRRPIVNGAVPDSAFVLNPGPNARQVDIGFAKPVRERWPG